MSGPLLVAVARLINYTMRAYLVFVSCWLALRRRACTKTRRTDASRCRARFCRSTRRARLVTVKHEEIKGLHAGDDDAVRSAATPRLLDGLAPRRSDQRHAGRRSRTARYLTGIRKVGPGAAREAARRGAEPAASSGFELLKPGEAVPRRRASSIRTARSAASARSRARRS